MSDKKDRLTLFGEFADKSIEHDFRIQMVGRYTKAAAFVVLVFGLIFLMFIGNDYSANAGNSAFSIIFIARVLVFIVSSAAFFILRRIQKHTTLIYFLTVYEAFVSIAYLVILGQYDSLSYLSIASLMVTSMAIYILPNRVMYTLIISIAMSIWFFLFPAQKIEELEVYDAYKVVAYQAVLLIYCNISAWLTNSYNRKQYAANRKLMALSVTDPLTGIYNRAKFDEELDRCVNFSNRYGNPLSLIMFDIDNFKIINDSHGHLKGDSIIKNLVDTVKRSIRNTDIFSRWGGDEFVILLPNTGHEQAEQIAKRMRKYVLHNLHDTTKNITCSFGTATLEKDETAQSLMQRVDKLLLQAKAKGKNMVVS